MNLDNILLQNGVKREDIGLKKRFQRDDTPPYATSLIMTRYLSTKKTGQQQDDLPFEITSKKSKFVFHTDEILKMRIQKIDQLTELYETQKQTIPQLMEANKVSLYNSKPIDQRRQFYFCYLSAISNAPSYVGFKHYQDLISLTKLWRNKVFQASKAPLQTSIQYCIHPGCICLALHGSKYCTWHICEDRNQVLFLPCPRCGIPVMINGVTQCPIHKGSR